MGQKIKVGVFFWTQCMSLRPIAFDSITEVFVLSGVDLSQNKEGRGQSGKAIKLFQVPQKMFYLPFLTCLSSLTM